MRLVQTISALPEYYDRAATNVTLNANVDSVAPHTSTVRASYTVPAGMRALVDSVFMLITRGDLATSLGRVRITLMYTPAGGSAIPIAVLQHQVNSYYYTVAETFTGLGLLQAGDELQIVTLDDGTGGTCSYWCTVKVFEFE